MNKKVILPLEKNPVFTVYQLHAYELGIMQAAYISIRPWIYNKNINLQYLCKEKRFTFITYDRWLVNEGIMECQKLRLQKSMLDSNNFNVFLLIKEMLDNDYYVYCRYNEFYIPHKGVYQKYQRDHDGLIYGYNDDEGIYYSIGYTDDWIYKAFTFKYDEFIQGVTNLKSRQPIFDFVKPNITFKNEINLKEICDDLYDYLHSVNTRPNAMENSLYGINCFRVFVDYINGIKDSNQNIDIRHCRLFSELKALMFERIEYLVQNDYLKSEALIIEYKPIKNNSEMIHNLCLKYNITKNTALLDRIVSYQNDIIEKEHMILSGVLNELYELLKDKNNLRGLR